MSPANRFASEVARLRSTALDGPAETERELRLAVARRAGALAVGEEPPPVPAALAPYVDKVALHAYKVVDGDVEALKAAGYSEDAIFEITVAVAVGSALERLERSLVALREERN
jgi:alkylhydroperoxidase family enzyme